MRVLTAVDTSTVNWFRLMDFFLGGRDNFEVDREVYARLSSFAPAVPLVFKEERECLRRMLRFLYGPARVDQFVFIRAGLPAPGGDFHDEILHVNPEAKVVYVDDDAAAAFGHAVREVPGCGQVAMESCFDPDLLGSHSIGRFIDFERPVALVQANSLQAVADTTVAQKLMASYIRDLAPGSYVALTHLYGPGDNSMLGHLAARIRGVLNSPTTPTTFRTAEEITSLVDGLSILDATDTHCPEADGPLAPPARWWPNGPRVDDNLPNLPFELGLEQRVMRAALAFKDETNEVPGRRLPDDHT